MKKYYAFSDIHGYYDILQHILDYCEEDSCIIFLGDAADRGPDGLKCIQTLLGDPRVIYLKGNHEEFFIDVYKEFTTEREWMELDFYHSAMYIWFSNGGDQTWYQFQELSNTEQFKLIQKLKSLPIYNEIKINNQDYFFCHSGCSEDDILLEDKANHAEKFIWNRDHLKHNGTLLPITIIHGHTPVQALKSFSLLDKNSTGLKMVRYDNGHKIDLDMGIFVSEIGCLYDIINNTPIYFNKNGLIK